MTSQPDADANNRRDLAEALRGALPYAEEAFVEQGPPYDIRDRILGAARKALAAYDARPRAGGAPPPLPGTTGWFAP